MWDEQMDQANKEYGGTSKFFQTKEGENVIRIVSTPTVLGQHYFKNAPTGKKWLVCVGKEKNCFGCENNNKPSASFLFWVIDRDKDNGGIKQAKLSYTLLAKIKATIKLKDYEFTPNTQGIFPYDINIIRIEASGKKTDYNILPKEKTELTEKELAEIKELPITAKVVAEMKQEVLDRMVKKPSETAEEKSVEVPVEEVPVDEEEIDVSKIPF